MNKILYIFFLICCCSLNAQDNTKQIQQAFDNLVNAYGNAKAAPLLQIETDKQSTPAIYFSSPKPKIVVDNYFYEMCKSFGKDSLNAFSIVISHELAHYYNDHSFCADFAFAVRNENNDLSKKLKGYSKSQIIVLETEADNKAIYYSAIAGYDPFKIYNELLDKIYEFYNLPEVMDNYPSKSERKGIYTQTSKNAAKLYNDFRDGINYLKTNEFDKAILVFENLNRYFPSRENYNNLGLAKTFKALTIRPISRDEYMEAEKFAYPLEIDSVSYLEKSLERSLSSDSEKEINELLQSAKKDFEKAILLDPNYVPAYVHLACVYDLLGNPEAAIGKLKELSLENQSITSVRKIMAIAYYHIGNQLKAEEIWKYGNK